ncbi:uncharacterized protein PITG_00829 [Phytophthora infestans T30-4]|uniref:Uncharacterized protein n=1 Tax=Phytophthora infestans (strain T30-4) TaxID=403677 RepID=D0MRS6_PHYIT|nr:uncharacterized protein PITG_00829 [Phytophthora infestans T30-4]EEY58195.1 conserved hypothetical protein [Phytophthora infestans T30-4]|eukprot:XP_002909381.1 conserved hypothetical protein [Phytophthora infestans T30-4]
MSSKREVRTSTGETATEYKERRDATERRRKIRVLHAGEIYADMYAEYIAIGCSFVMLFFFRHHPQYEFNAQLVNLGYLQMTVEVVVDFLACVLEATRGVEFKSFDQNDPFLIFFLAMLTFSNIGISAGLYMH